MVLSYTAILYEAKNIIVKHKIRLITWLYSYAFVWLTECFKLPKISCALCAVASRFKIITGRLFDQAS